MSTIPVSVATINADRGSCPTFLNRLLSELQRNSFPDIVCLQEAPETSFLNDHDINIHYKLICISVDPSRDEKRMMTLLCRTSRWKVKWSSTAVSGLNENKRVSQIVSLCYGDTKLYVANVHLHGGNDDDRLYADSTVSSIYSIKSEPVLRICYCDLVVGDFGSLVNPFSNSEYIEYMRSLGWDTDGIIAWNDAPFNILRKYSFYRVKYNDPTSLHGTTPDHIIHRRKLKLTFLEKLDMNASTYGFSDHDGIIARFSLQI